MPYPQYKSKIVQHVHIVYLIFYLVETMYAPGRFARVSYLSYFIEQS